MARSMSKGHKHLSAAPTVFTDVVLDRRVAALEAVFIPQPLKNPLGSVPLLAVLGEILCKPLVDEASETIQLRPLDLGRPPIAWWNRKARDLLHPLCQGSCPLLYFSSIYQVGGIG